MKKVDLDIDGILIPIIYEKDDSGVVFLKLVFRVAGAINNSKAGLAKLLAALLNEGSKTLGVNEFNRRLEIRAIELSAKAGFETLEISISCLKEHFEFAFDMLLKLLKDPNFSKETLNKLKVQTQGKIAASSSDFDYQASIKLNEILFCEPTLKVPSIGTKESIESIDLDDIKSFLNSYLNLANLFIVFGGDAEISAVDLTKLSKALNIGQKREIKQIRPNDDQKKEFIKRQTQQAYIYFGSPYDIQNHQKYLANIATFILGSSGFGSRLMEEIRVKRGLAYSVYARCDFCLSFKILSGYLQTKNENRDAAIELISTEIDKFVKNGVTQKELESAKNFLLGSEPLSKETLLKRLFIAENEHYFGYDLGEFDRNLELIRALELADLNEFIRTHSEITKLSFAVIYDEV